MANWEPIESAPRDGRQILTWRGDSYVVHVQGGSWYQTSFWSTHRQCFVGWPKESEPTHWMPLPDPPIAEGAA